MGGRGSFAGKTRKAEWSQLPLSVLGVNEIMGHKMIRNVNSKNAKTPLVIDEKNAIMLICDERGKISQIAEYVNHDIVFTVDLDYSRGPHGHIADKTGRISHDTANVFNVPKKYRKLLGKVADHNLASFGISLPKNRKTYPDVDIRKLIRQRKK